ncbi:heme ABC transporter ATP-binding protein [Pseudomonas sp. NW5]|uniref:heme ABC transporter ATP-binding protein n=1 Tax=Pseudomonas sp. NW5 TaxID=2934934 RepID=UPI002022631F|nr:heme ABC transporter ATP-binding protein [Pseudomonas sp. NW5]MCL7461991.1 heme ABC transporter ATP-binding protein [Pseudomonas sp. NW5]
MLQARRLSVRRGPCPVLEGIELSLQGGEVLGVLGPNGAGKSSLLAALSGELAPADGEVLLGGQPLARLAARQRARQLAVLPQRSALQFDFRVEEVVALGRLPHADTPDSARQALEGALQAADILHLRPRDYLGLSGGERQRVQLARVLAQLWPGRAGQVLLLDEPTAMLDPLHQHACLQAARTLAARGVAVLVILHDLNLAARYCDRLLLLAGGRVQALGTVAEVLRAEVLQAVFGLQVLIQPHPERGHPVVIAR